MPHRSAYADGRNSSPTRSRQLRRRRPRPRTGRSPSAAAPRSRRRRGSRPGCGRRCRPSIRSRIGALAVAVEQLRPVDVDLALGGLDDLAAVGLAVEALAADPDRRGHRQPLAHVAGGQLSASARAGLGELAVGVAGARAPAEPRRRQIGLRQAGEEALHPGRPAEQDEQQAGREGVERAGVAGLAAALAAHPRRPCRAR